MFEKRLQKSNRSTEKKMERGFFLKQGLLAWSKSRLKTSAMSEPKKSSSRNKGRQNHGCRDLLTVLVPGNVSRDANLHSLALVSSFSSLRQVSGMAHS